MNGAPENVGVLISAQITDPSGVGAVNLRYRVSGGGAFATLAMTDAGGGNFSATIPAASVTRAGVDYYISAADNAAPANVGTYPNKWAPTGGETPFTLYVQPLEPNAAQ